MTELLELTRDLNIVIGNITNVSTIDENHVLLVEKHTLEEKHSQTPLHLGAMLKPKTGQRR